MNSLKVTSFFVLLFLLCQSAQAQNNYPTKVVRIIVPSTSGGGGDALARLMAQHLTERWGKSVIVENRTGVSNMMGGEAVAKSPADGHVLLNGLSTLSINPSTHKKLLYDVNRDFAPIIHSISIPNIVMVHPSLPVKTALELAAAAKARPSQLLYGSGGYGTNNHLVIELFATLTQTRFTHVPYKNSGPALVDTIGGQLMVFATNMIGGIPYARSGRLRAIGVTSLTRANGASDIPTLNESGLPGFEAVQWYGLLAPAGTPKDIIDKIYKDSAAVLNMPEVKDRLNQDGATVIAANGEVFDKFIRSETIKWAKVVKAAGIVPE